MTPAERAAPAAQPATSPEQQAGMEKWQKAMAPGPSHAALEPMVGKFSVHSKWWMEPGGEPSESKGMSVQQWILGGRYVEQMFEGDFMGQPFHGIGYTGFDNVMGKYGGTWMDDMGTGMMMGSGQMNEAGNELTISGSMPGPEGNDVPTRMVTKIVGPTQHVFSMYGMQDGKEMLMMEITYTKM